jgi:ribosomal protein L34E
MIAAASCGVGWHGAGPRRARSGSSASLGARRSARQMGVLLCGGCSAARSRSASRRLCSEGGGVARGGAESDMIAAAACGVGWHGAGRRRARSGSSASLGARRSARQMGVLLCGGCSAARARSASHRLCSEGGGVARGGAESDMIAAAACGFGWHGAGRRRARSGSSALLGARRSARQMGVLFCGGCSAGRSRSASRVFMGLWDFVGAGIYCNRRTGTPWS